MRRARRLARFEMEKRQQEEIEALLQEVDPGAVVLNETTWFPHENTGGKWRVRYVVACQGRRLQMSGEGDSEQAAKVDALKNGVRLSLWGGLPT